MIYDGSNRKHIRQAEKRSRLEESNRIAYLRQIMSTLPGRAWMHDLLANCAMFHEPFHPMSPYATAYNCGKQAVGRRLFDDVFTNCSTEYALMMQEAQAKEIVDGKRNNTSSELPGSTDPRWYTQGSRGFDTDDTGLVHDDSPSYGQDPDDGDGAETTH